jgi:hypothetical protein
MQTKGQAVLGIYCRKIRSVATCQVLAGSYIAIEIRIHPEGVPCSFG